MHMYILRNAAAACLTMTTIASYNSNMFSSSSVYSAEHAHTHATQHYTHEYTSPSSAAKRGILHRTCSLLAAPGTPLPLTSLSCIATRYAGDAPLVPSEQREYYRRRRRTSTFPSQLLLRKHVACLFLHVGSYTVLNWLCSKARALFKT